MPGASRELVERAHSLGTRLSVNIETPEPDMMRRISPNKDLQKDILDPMAWINELTASSSGGAVGQATQFVVGAADESDRQIYRRVDQTVHRLEPQARLLPALPAGHAHPHGGKTSRPRRPRASASTRWTGSAASIVSGQTRLTWPSTTPVSFPWSRTPRRSSPWRIWTPSPSTSTPPRGISCSASPASAPSPPAGSCKTVADHTIDNWRDLQAMGVVRKRAWPYVVFPGQRPPSGRQLRMDLFGEAQDRRAAEAAGVSLPPTKSETVASIMETAAPYTTDHQCIPGSRGAACNSCPIMRPSPSQST